MLYELSYSPQYLGWEKYGRFKMGLRNWGEIKKEGWLMMSVIMLCWIWCIYSKGKKKMWGRE
jgi:hypothetical protein